jgi:hypothetical protein
MEGSPSHFVEGSQWLQMPTPDSNQPTARFYALSSIIGITCIETNPVENFGAPEAIVSMQASTRNAIKSANSIVGLRLSKTD